MFFNKGFLKRFFFRGHFSLMKKLRKAKIQNPIMVMGAIGAGKEQVFRSLVQNVLSIQKKDPGVRLIMFSSPGFLTVNHVTDIAQEDSIILLDAFSKNEQSFSWDIAFDLTNQETIKAFSDGIVNGLFPDMVRNFAEELKSALTRSIERLVNNSIKKTGSCVNWAWGDLVFELAIEIKKLGSDSLISDSLSQICILFKNIQDSWGPECLKFSINAWYDTKRFKELERKSGSFLDIKNRNVLVIKGAFKRNSMFPIKGFIEPKDQFTLIAHAFLSVFSAISPQPFKESKMSKPGTWLFLSDSMNIKLSKELIQNVFSNFKNKGLQVVFGSFGLSELDRCGEKIKNLVLSNISDFIYLRNPAISTLDYAVKKFKKSERELLNLGPKTSGITSFCLDSRGKYVKKIMWPYLSWRKRQY